MRHATISRIAACLACLSAPFAAPATAQPAYPSRPLQIVVPFAAGGNTDLLTRVLADQLALAFRQPVTVVSKPGAGANLGAAYVANSDPDGETLLMTPPGPLAINEFLYPSLAFDPATAFAPVVLVARFPNVLVVAPSLGVHSVKELIDLARAKPGGLDYASAGVGSTGQLSSMLFMSMAGVTFNHVPYKGTGQGLQDVLAGRIAMTIDNLGPILPFIQSSQVIALGVTTKEPVKLLPGIPPIGDVVPGYQASSWNAIMAPAGTPKPIIARLNAEANRILQMPEVQDKLRAFGSEPAGGTPEELRDLIAEERARWRPLIAMSQGK
jgi:tripartite-type tricarboxylate transporter receptor subunit TctC